MEYNGLPVRGLGEPHFSITGISLNLRTDLPLVPVLPPIGQFLTQVLLKTGRQEIGMLGDPVLQAYDIMPELATISMDG